MRGDDPRGGSKTTLAILVVDDEKLVANMLERVLERGGHRVEAVTEVDQAWSHVARRDFDVVLADQNLRDQEGLTFLDELEACLREAGRPLPASFVMSGDRRSWPRPHIAKPFDLDELRTMLDMLVQRRRQG